MSTPTRRPVHAMSTPTRRPGLSTVPEEGMAYNISADDTDPLDVGTLQEFSNGGEVMLPYKGFLKDIIEGNGKRKRVVFIEVHATSGLSDGGYKVTIGGGSNGGSRNEIHIKIQTGPEKNLYNDVDRILQAGDWLPEVIDRCNQMNANLTMNGTKPVDEIMVIKLPFQLRGFYSRTGRDEDGVKAHNVMFFPSNRHLKSNTAYTFTTIRLAVEVDVKYSTPGISGAVHWSSEKKVFNASNLQFEHNYDTPRTDNRDPGGYDSLVGDANRRYGGNHHDDDYESGISYSQGTNLSSCTSMRDDHTLHGMRFRQAEEDSYLDENHHDADTTMYENDDSTLGGTWYSNHHNRQSSMTSIARTAHSSSSKRSSYHSNNSTTHNNWDNSENENENESGTFFTSQGEECNDSKMPTSSSTSVNTSRTHRKRRSSNGMPSSSQSVSSVADSDVDCRNDIVNNAHKMDHQKPPPSVAGNRSAKSKKSEWNALESVKSVKSAPVATFSARSPAAIPSSISVPSSGDKSLSHPRHKNRLKNSGHIIGRTFHDTTNSSDCHVVNEDDTTAQSSLDTRQLLGLASTSTQHFASGESFVDSSLPSHPTRTTTGATSKSKSTITRSQSGKIKKKDYKKYA